MEAELVCVDSYGKKAGLGVLAGGFMFTVPLHTVRQEDSRGNCSNSIKALFRSCRSRFFEISFPGFFVNPDLDQGF
jgi:hypothetical protein